MAAEIITLRDGSDLGRQVPPPGMQDNLRLATETPGSNAGSFSYTDANYQKEDYTGKFLFPFNPVWRTAMPDYDALAKGEIISTWEPMSGDTMRANAKEALKVELLIAYDRFRYYPTDPLTGIPYPILPIDPPTEGLPRRFDYHHQFHPRAVLVESGDIADSALRVCRGQDIPRWLHDRYHARYDGPHFPRGISDRFATIVLACAGVVPRQAMYLGQDNNVLVTPSVAQYERIRSTIHYEYKDKEGKRTIDRNRSKLGIFFAQYALEQDIRDLVDDLLINRFLEPRSERERLLTGNTILAAAINASTEPIQPKYLEAFKDIRVDTKPRNLANVVTRYFKPERKKDYFNELKRRLEVA